MQKPQDICERTFAFSLRILKLVAAIPRGVAGEVVARQLMRAGCGVGANVEEARGSTSRKEYSRRMSIALSEAREALYWLRVVHGGGLLKKDRLDEIITEADEIVRVLTTIVKRTKATK